MGQARYACSHCGTTLPVGARWCPVCLKGTDSAVHVPTAEAVVPVTPERVVDSTPIWAGATSDTRAVHEHERFAQPEFSRWKRGTTTWGPVAKVAVTIGVFLPVAWLWWVVAGGVGSVPARWFVIGLSGAWLTAAYVILRDVWRKERVDAARAPVAASLRETGRSFQRDIAERRRPSSATPAIVCATCGAGRQEHERTCYRCGTEQWRTTDRSIEEDFAICGGCGMRWHGQRPWCVACHSPRTQILWIQPAASPSQVLTVKPPRPYIERRRATLGNVLRVLITVVLLAGFLAFPSVPGKVVVPLFAPYVFLVVLFLRSIWRKDNRW